MKLTFTRPKSSKKTILTLFSLIVAGVLTSHSAYSQIDYEYGINKKGFRLSIGAGAAILQTYWDTNPLRPVGVANIDYNFNPYLSVGIEGQGGLLAGKDTKNKEHYSSVKFNYIQGNINIKAAVGQFFNIDATNGLTSALKSLYLGPGVGVISVKSILTTDGNPNVAIPVSNYYGTAHSPSYTPTYGVVLLDVGTNIDLFSIIGKDILSINPNYQYNYVLSKTFDGYQPAATSGYGAYSTFTVSLKYKF